MSNTFSLIPLPQDMTIVNKDGQFTPAWQNALTKLSAIAPALNKYAAATTETIDANASASNATDAALGIRASALEGNLGQDPVANIDAAIVLAVGAAYLQAEIVAIRDALLADRVKINEILATLRASKILSEA